GLASGFGYRELGDRLLYLLEAAGDGEPETWRRCLGILLLALQPARFDRDPCRIRRRDLLGYRRYLADAADRVRQHRHGRHWIEYSSLDCDDLKLDRLDFVEAVENEGNRVTVVRIGEPSGRRLEMVFRLALLMGAGRDLSHRYRMRLPCRLHREIVGHSSMSRVLVQVLEGRLRIVAAMGIRVG